MDIQAVLDFPRKTGVVKISATDSLDAVRQKVAAALDFSAEKLQGYMVFRAPFGQDVCHLDAETTEGKTAADLELDRATLCFFAPNAIKPTRILKPDAEEEEEQEGKFKGLTPTKAITMLSTATPAQLNRVWEYIDANTESVLACRGFLNASPSTVQKVISRDTIAVNEVDLFSSLLNWAKKQADAKNQDSSSPEVIKKFLGDFIQLVRFPLMEVKDIGATVVPSGLLDTSQTLALFTYLSSPDEKKAMPDALKVFNSAPRNPPFRTVLWYMNTSPSSASYNFDYPRGYNVTVSKRTVISGFTARAQAHSGDSSIHVYENGVDKKTSKKKTVDKKDPTLFHYDLKYVMKPGVQYQVMLHLPSGTSFYYSNGHNNARTVDQFSITSKYYYTNGVADNTYALDIGVKCS